jgi:hypothetical protein
MILLNGVIFLYELEDDILRSPIKSLQIEFSKFIKIVAEKEEAEG